MFNFFKKRVLFDINKEDYIIFSLYDNQLKKFYSLVLFKDRQQFLNSLCYTFDKSKENELLKVKMNDLYMYQIGIFNAINAEIFSDLKYIGRFTDLIDDYKIKNLKGEKIKDVNEDKKDKNSI